MIKQATVTQLRSTEPLRILTSLFEKAIVHYETVAAHLKTVSDTYPFVECEHEPIGADDRIEATAAILEQAREAETAGLEVLAELVAGLEN